MGHRTYKKSLFTFFLLGVIFGFSIIHKPNPLIPEVSNFIFYNYLINDFFVSDLLSFFINLFPLLIAIFYFGSLIYSLFVDAAPYYFTRQPNKTIWLKNQKFHLFAIITLSMIFYYLGLITCSFIVNQRFITDRFDIFLLQLVLDILFIYLMSLSMNIISIKYGSQNSLVIIYSVLISLLVLLNLHERLLPLDTIAGYVVFLLNPISNLVMRWHILDSNLINYVSFSYNIPILFSLFYLLFWIIVVSKISDRVVNNHNLLPNVER